MITNPSSQELAEEMRQVLKETRMTPDEHFEFLVKHGIIDRDGKVLVCKYFATDPVHGANGVPVTPAPQQTNSDQLK